MGAPLLPAFLLLCWAGAASSAGPALKTLRVGDAVTLPVALPQSPPSANIFLRDTSRGEGIAIWEPSGEIYVTGEDYSGRVAFQRDPMAFTIANLSLADGGVYEVSLGTSPEKLLSSFLVAVFNVIDRVSSVQNDSCQVHLECQAGMGPNQRVTYTWKDAEAKTTLGQGPRITQLMFLNQEKAYICVAQVPAQDPSTFRIALKNPCANAAAPGPWTLGSLLAGGFLVPVVLLLL